MAIGITCCSIAVAVLGGGVYLVQRIFSSIFDDIDLDLTEKDDDSND